MPGSLDPDAVWRTVEREKVNGLTVVGDAVARPLLDAWDRAGGYDASSLFSFSNGGAPMSPATRERVFATLPHVIVADGFGSSEAGTQGSMRVAAGDRPAGASLVRFDEPAKPTIVVDADGNEVSPGSGVVGQVLAGGRLPLGYYNDPDKTAAAFVDRASERWLVTGDMATVGADGAIELLGRGSVAVNTGGEKVFPEEVEAVLKAHPAVYDCLVVGVPDERWGSAVTAVVRPVEGSTPTLGDLTAHCKSRMASYKAPKHLVLVDRVVRSPSGKADYRWARTAAEKAIGG
jgi:3-oxocholest-4-en-26-oate---CoA ligase